MESVKEELIKFREYTLELLKTLDEDNIHLIPILLEKRQGIINSLSKISIDSKNYRDIEKDLQLLELEMKLQESYSSKKQEIYIKMQENKNNMAANNVYIFSTRAPLNIIDKKI